MTTDDKSFESQELKIVKLPKIIPVPTINNINAENCSIFVDTVLVNNDIKIDSKYLNNIFKNGLS
jgi:hypothetical protein